MTQSADLLEIANTTPVQTPDWLKDKSGSHKEFFTTWLNEYIQEVQTRQGKVRDVQVAKEANKSIGQAANLFFTVLEYYGGDIENPEDVNKAATECLKIQNDGGPPEEVFNLIDRVNVVRLARKVKKL